MSKAERPKVGKFPNIGTIRADTLEVLLASRDMAASESIFDTRKVALSTVVRALIRKYGWPIERRDFPTNTADGRGAWASVYCLPDDVIEAALQSGGREWLDANRIARLGRSRQVRPGFVPSEGE